MENRRITVRLAGRHTWCWSVLFAIAVWAFPAFPATAMEVRLRAQLVWGTNDQAPADGKHPELTGALKEKLARVFKWKNYYQIKDQSFTVQPGEARRVKMSSKCELELKLVDDFTLEVKLFGEGTLVKTVRQPLQALRQGEIAVLAGDSKEKFGDAWFVVLSAPRN
jgi:hypothetical protein